MEQLPLVVVVAERPQAVGDGGAGGLGPAGDEQAGLVEDGLDVELLPVDLGVGPGRQEAVRRAPPQLGDLGHQLARRRDPGLDAWVAERRAQPQSGRAGGGSVPDESPAR